MDETEKPKRSYIRRAFTGNDKADEVINDAVEDAADASLEEDGIVCEEVEEETKPLRFLGEEPISNSVKAKIIKTLGINKTMEYKPWKKIDHWACGKCGWTTFDRYRAKRHACE